MNFKIWISTFAICFFSLSIPAASVSLAWNPSPDQSVVNYNVYYGVASGAYTNVGSAGLATTLTISNLVEGVTYYFAATALNNFGLESDFSNEAVYTLPSVVLTLAEALDTPGWTWATGGHCGVVCADQWDA